MEKLQSALEKARAKRGDASPRSRHFTGPQRSPSKDRRAELWNEFETFTPSEETLRRNLVMTAQASNDATPFDILRTKVLLQMQQNNWKRLAITSPMPGAGKSTLACNLAMAFGRQQGLRAMLLDFDLRTPRIHEYFQYKTNRSIEPFLEGRTTAKEQAVRIGDNLAVFASGQSIADPSRILLSDDMDEVLDEVQNTYQPDIMIFDLPSVLVSDDARAFLNSVDCALIVVRANKTRYSQFDRCEREVAEHTNVVGTVVNAYQHAGTNAELE